MNPHDLIVAFNRFVTLWAYGFVAVVVLTFLLIWGGKVWRAWRERRAERRAEDWRLDRSGADYVPWQEQDLADRSRVLRGQRVSPRRSPRSDHRPAA